QLDRTADRITSPGVVRHQQLELVAALGDAAPERTRREHLAVLAVDVGDVDHLVVRNHGAEHRPTVTRRQLSVAKEDVAQGITFAHAEVRVSHGDPWPGWPPPGGSRRFGDTELAEGEPGAQLRPAGGASLRGSSLKYSRPQRHSTYGTTR